MRIQKYKSITLLLSVICYLLSAPLALADLDPTFDPNYIISDAEILDADAMTLRQIQRFLETKESYLANYKTTNAYGEMKSAAEIIYDAANNNYDCDGVTLEDRYDITEVKAKCTHMTTVSPQFLLVLVQKEMSLITDDSPSERQLDFAVGYGCPDGGSCSSTWKGFGKQINSAALQFKDYMDNPKYYTYKAGQTYTFSNPYSTIADEVNIVTPANQATAALYNYTPHVYNGNYNFYILWNKYFTKFYPEGTLMQAEGEAGVWLIQGNQRRPFTTKSALTSRYDEKKIITVSESDLEKYEIGMPISLPQYAIIQSPDGKRYLIVDEYKREITSNEAFRLLGFNPEEIIEVSWADVRSFTLGKPINEFSTYPTGALLQDNESGGVYWVIDGKKAPLLDSIFLKTKFKNRKITQVSSEELAKYTTVDPYKFEDSELLKTPASPVVYLIDDGTKRAIDSEEIFLGLGYKWSNIIDVPQRILDLYDDGQPLAEVFGQ